MKLFDLKGHLESAPLIAGATRSAWEGKAHVVIGAAGGFLYISISGSTPPGDKYQLFGCNFEDAVADDWEPV